MNFVLKSKLGYFRANDHPTNSLEQATVFTLSLDNHTLSVEPPDAEVDRGVTWNIVPVYRSIEEIVPSLPKK